MSDDPTCMLILDDVSQAWDDLFVSQHGITVTKARLVQLKIIRRDALGGWPIEHQYAWAKVCCEEGEEPSRLRSLNPAYDTSPPEGFGSYHVTVDNKEVLFAIDSDDNRYKVVAKTYWHHGFEVIVRGALNYNKNKDGDVVTRKVNYAVKIEHSQLIDPSKATYLKLQRNAPVMKVTYGEWSSGFFVPWTTQLYVSIKTLEHWSHPSRWGLHSAEQDETWPAEDDPVVECGVGKYVIEERPDAKEPLIPVLCVWTPPSAGAKKRNEDAAGTWTKLCKLHHHAGIAAMYQYANREQGNPWVRLSVECVVNPRGSTDITITPEVNTILSAATIRALKTLKCEVLLQLDKLDDRNLGIPFGNCSPFLMVQKSMKAEHLTCYIDKFTMPAPLTIVGNFGRQVGTTLFVYGNCCYQEGRVFGHEEAGITVLPSLFTQGAHLPLLAKDFPRLMCVPQPWVRWMFFASLWKQVIPKVFLNNTLGAKIAFAASLSHLHCHDFWKGDGVHNGVGAVWLFSPEPFTGKTQMLTLINSLMGWYHKGLSMGAQSSLPGQVTRLSSLQADSSLCLDEIATKSTLESEVSKKIKDITHMTHDGTTREVCGKLPQKVMTQYVGTSNIMPNAKDQAFMQRCIKITFDPLVTSGPEDVDVSLQWEAAKEMVSCMQPDFEQLLHDGKLDKTALRHCCEWVNAIVRERRSRSANLWGITTYYYLQCAHLALELPDQRAVTLEYIARQAVSAHASSTKNAGYKEQFIIAFDEAQRQQSDLTAQVTKVVHWHNFRTMLKPSGYHSMAEVEWYAIRIPLVCSVINAVLNKQFAPQSVVNSFHNCDWAITGDRGMFYDPSKAGWPITKSLYFEETQQNETVPLPETELLSSSLTKQRCLFVKRKEFDAIVQSAEVGGDIDDVRCDHIVIHDPSMDDYNFVEYVCCRADTVWFGYRAWKDTAFGPYLGYGNHVHMLEDGRLTTYDAIVEKNLQSGWGAMEEMYKLNRLIEFFGFDVYSPLDDNALPPCIAFNPFVFRNDEDDEHEMPDDIPTRIELHELQKAPLTPSKRLPEWRSGEDTAGCDPGSGSNRTPLSRGDSAANASPGMPKAPKRKCFVRRLPDDPSDDEGEDLMEDDEEEGDEEPDSDDANFIDDPQGGDGDDYPPASPPSDNDDEDVENEIEEFYGRYTRCMTCGDEISPHQQMCLHCTRHSMHLSGAFEGNYH